MKKNNKKQLSESINISKWYRGYNSSKGNERTHLLWMTSDIDYAKEYGDTIIEYTIDDNKLNCEGLYGIDEVLGYEIDYITGPDIDECKILLNNGIDSYCFDAGENDSECLCLWNKKAIISQRIIEDKNTKLSNNDLENMIYECIVKILKANL